MKKISFSERYGMQQAVLDGTKTMTRRIIPLCERDLKFLKVTDKGEWLFSSRTCLDGAFPAYKIGEEVAVAQRYEDAIHSLDWVNKLLYEDEPGWKNKMFVRADLMPHRIRITDIRVERLQDISNKDCMKEGIRQSVVEYGDKKIVQWTYFDEKRTIWFDSPRDAFASLIDRISGRGTWQRNPWVYVYEFELIK